MTKRARLAVLMAAGAIALACVPQKEFLRPYAPASSPRVNLCTSDACPDSVELMYLGVGGFVVRHQGQAVLTAPSFTHHGVGKVLLPWPYRFRADTALVNDRMEQVERQHELRAILVGHAHYDHLLDVPHVARKLQAGTPIYGSPTMQHVLSGDSVAAKLAHSVADSLGGAGRAGKWIYAAGGGLRFMPLRSTHAPNLGFYTFSSGRQSAPRTNLPRTARGWRMGEVYAWLIDVIAADSTPRFRMYYQDSAADSAYLEMPRFSGRDSIGVDVAILCVGSYDKVANSPDVILSALRPRHVVLGHWEDFFRDARDSLQAVRAVDTERLARRLDARMGADGWLTPEPMTRVTFRY